MFTIVVERDGERAAHVTPIAETVRFSSASPGGFGAGSFSVAEGHAPLFPHLALVRIMWNAETAWEGRVEDRGQDLSGTGVHSITCFGLRRLLEDTSLKRIWSLRAIPWQPSVPATGLGLVDGVTPILTPSSMFATVGTFDPTDRTRVGILVDNYQPSTTAHSHANWAIWVVPDGIELQQVHAKISNLLASRLFAQVSREGASWTTVYDADVSPIPSESEFSIPRGTRQLMLGSMATGAGNNGVWEDIRLLCTDVREDVEGAFFPHTLMRDVVLQVPGLTAGRIDDSAGGDGGFDIQALARPVRGSAMTVVEEISAFYANDWAVWEDGLFDWMPSNLDASQWIVSRGGFSALNLDSSIAEIAETVYLIYENAATGEPGEASSTSVSQLNPFVKSAAIKDLVLSAPVVMTPNSANRLAEILAEQRGGFPTARGTGTLAADALIQHSDGGVKPAAMVRAGQNITIPDLPKSDVLVGGRDGQTLFRVTSVDTDMKRNLTTFTFDSHSRRVDVLLARLSAATRVLTG